LNGYDFSFVQALSIAGPTFAIGVILGWVLSSLHFGGSSRDKNHPEKEDRRR
jgi:hypothetical protein